MKLAVKSVFYAVVLGLVLYSCTKPDGGEETPLPSEPVVTSSEYLFALQDDSVLEEGDSVSVVLLGQKSAYSYVKEVFISEGGQNYR